MQPLHDPQIPWPLLYVRSWLKEQDLIKPYKAYNLGDAIHSGIFLSHRVFDHFMIYAIPMPN
ncbi:hypothetical protein F7734_14535 [Scytonema sp. UIC 10036]|uniref:hypothetical protein n=1 Tax=Scytonema sp. UIC 10036 TaxID=2304196 RepID=UPI0012DAEB2B|nr:hypothetical protein [Scytonema sp. UIC 10036]MUG93575.1 hypothetical protein [Scytonema sp. UIC 10036]